MPATSTKLYTIRLKVRITQPLKWLIVHVNSCALKSLFIIPYGPSLPFCHWLGIGLLVSTVMYYCGRDYIASGTCIERQFLPRKPGIGEVSVACYFNQIRSIRVSFAHAHDR